MITSLVTVPALLAHPELDVLLGMCRAEPREETHLRILADWLEEHGYPQRAGGLRAVLGLCRTARDMPLRRSQRRPSYPPTELDPVSHVLSYRLYSYGGRWVALMIYVILRTTPARGDERHGWLRLYYDNTMASGRFERLWSQADPSMLGTILDCALFAPLGLLPFHPNDAPALWRGMASVLPTLECWERWADQVARLDNPPELRSSLETDDAGRLRD